MNCDFIAGWYRWLEYAGFGRALERRRVAFLDDVKDARRALVLGDGDGRFLERLVEQNRSASIDYVDVSARMLDLARARAGASVHYHLADARTMPLPDREYDLIATHFFLDCLNERDAETVVSRVAAAARPDAHWIVSEFRDQAWWGRALVGVLYLFFRLSTGLRTNRLVDYHPLLKRAGFRLSKQQSARFGLLRSEFWVRGSV